MTDATKSPVVVGGERGWAEPGALDLLLASIFSSAEFREFLKGQVAAKEMAISDQADLIRLLHEFFQANLGWDQPMLRENLASALGDLARHQSDTVAGATAYTAEGRENPASIFWPNPTREGGVGLGRTLPELGNIPIVGPDTPIGSAGSCFAYEIARTLQRWGFNYVIGEKEHDRSNGVVVDAFDGQTDEVRFNATWGLIFSTPSLRQLAERAFGVGSLPRIVVREKSKAGKVFYTDPFREGVAFDTPDVYTADYDAHTKACHKVFTETEVFIVTLGLNECWAFKTDGSVLSNLPRRPEIYSLVQPRLLTVEENVTELQGFLDLVRRHNPGFRLIVSLSPVPLMATFRKDRHVVTANAHSKAVLRVAAEEFISRNDDVYYFPSYEYVMHCAADAWMPDLRHVTDETVAEIMAMFRRMFVLEGANALPGG